jgi:peptidoglycan/xylan/chitin deacetylase (PgdA/CDA1 family)
MQLRHVIKLSAAALWPRRVMLRGSRHGGALAITFDDGPHPQQTPVLLEALAKAGVKATFFLQGDHAAKWPALVRETHAQGHQVANHGWSHTSAKKMQASVFADEVERTQALLQDIVGSPLARDFRPPYGDITPAAFWALARKNYRFVYWTADSDDSHHRDVPSLVSQVASLHARQGDIVLFHEDYAHTVAAMPQLIDVFRASGLAFRRIDGLSA